MCFAVSAPGGGNVNVLLKGGLCEDEGKDPLHDSCLRETCRQGLERAAERQWRALHNYGPSGQR